MNLNFLFLHLLKQLVLQSVQQTFISSSILTKYLKSSTGYTYAYTVPHCTSNSSQWKNNLMLATIINIQVDRTIDRRINMLKHTFYLHLKCCIEFIKIFIVSEKNSIKIYMIIYDLLSEECKFFVTLNWVCSITIQLTIPIQKICCHSFYVI